MGRGWFALLVKVFAAICATGVTVAAALYAAEIWTPKKAHLIWWLCLASAVPLVSSVVTAVREFLEPRRANRRETVAQLLRVAFFQVWRATRVQPEEIGIAAYRMKRRWWCLPPFGKFRLERLYRDRARNRMNTSGVKWAPGKGVIGLAVSDKQFVASDLGAAWAGLSNCSKTAWEAESDETRQGLSHDEFLKLQDKHGAVVAMPILDDDGNVLGCVAVDGPEGSFAKLTKVEVQRHLADAAVAVYLSVLKPSR